jgi:hypothetical protein
VGAQQGLEGGDLRRVLPGSGEAGVGVVDAEGGAEDGNLGSECGVDGDQGARPGRCSGRGPAAGVGAYLVGETCDKVFTPGEIGTPMRILLQRRGIAGSQRRTPTPQEWVPVGSMR